MSEYQGGFKRYFKRYPIQHCAVVLLLCCTFQCELPCELSANSNSIISLTHYSDVSFLKQNLLYIFVSF